MLESSFNFKCAEYRLRALTVSKVSNLFLNFKYHHELKDFFYLGGVSPS